MKMTEQTDNSASLLLWGPPFSGKSVLASQFPNPHFVSLDPHTLTSVRGLKARYALNFDVNIIDINMGETTDEDFKALCGSYGKEHAWQKTLRLVEAWSRTLTPNDTLVLDNITRCSEYILSWIRKTVGRAQLQIQDWGVFVTQMEALVECLNHPERKCNVVIIGHEEPHKDELTNEIRRYLLMPTKARYRIPSTITDYLYMYTVLKVVGGKRVPIRMLKSLPTHDAQTGSRSLIPDTEYPTYAKMKPFLDASLGRTLPEPNWTPKVDE